MRSITGICGAILATVCLAPGVRANDNRLLLTFPPIHGKITAAYGAQDAVSQSSQTSTTTVKPPKAKKAHVKTKPTPVQVVSGAPR